MPALEPNAPRSPAGPACATPAWLGRALGALALGDEDDEVRAELAERAVWLALAGGGEEVAAEVDAALAGRLWAARAATAAAAPEHAHDPGAGLPGEARAAAPRARAARGRGAGTRGEVGLARRAVGVVLATRAAAPREGAAERTAAALACAALACADPGVGAALAPLLGELGLLGLVQTVPVAARVRRLTLELRHRRLGPGARLPARFVARVEDLLERLDAEALLPRHLVDRAPPAAPALRALVGPASARTLALARVLAEAPAPFADLAALARACALDAPALWAGLPPADVERALARAYDRLRARLAGTPLALRARGGGRPLGPAARALPGRVHPGRSRGRAGA